MIAKLKITILHALTTVAVMSIVHAESAADVAFSFRAITWSDAPLAGLTIPTESQSLTVDAPISQRSRVYEYRGKNRMEIFKGPDAANGDPVASITANPNWSEVLFFLLPAAQGDRVQVYAVDDSLTRFPSNTVRFLNLSGKKLAGFLGDQQVVLENRDDKLLEADGSSDFLPLRFAENSDAQSGWKRFLSSAIGVNKGMRALIVFYPGQADDVRGSKSISYKLFYDYPAG